MFFKSPYIPLLQKGELSVSLYERETERDFNMGKKKKRGAAAPLGLLQEM